ncbi:MAG: hypothetical protein Fur002_25190 [Anaerolineales bacterium]
MSEQTETRKTKVFISYSRRNKLFVRKLNDALDAAGVDAWVDWEGIPLSSDWMAEITAAIEAADAFVFVISPDSLKSKVCAEELELGVKLNKKIIPVLYLDPLKGQDMHQKLASTNWVYMRPKKDDFKATVPKLKEAIETDLGWVQSHTRLLQRATEWIQKERNGSYLLLGSDLEDGEHWMREATVKPGRDVTPLHAEYIGVSRKVAVQRQRNLMIGIAIALVISIFASFYAFQQRGVAIANQEKALSSQATAVANEHARATQQALAEESQKIAEMNANIAKARRSAAEAKIYQAKTGQLDSSTLLAVNAYNQLPDLRDAEDILRQNISLLALPVNKANVGAAVAKIQLSPDKMKFITSDDGGQSCVWNIEDGKQLLCVHQEGSIYDAIFSADGKYIVSGSSTGLVAVWDAVTGEQKKTFQYKGIIWDLNAHPNGLWVGVGSAEGVSIINVEKGTLDYFYNMPSPVRNIEFGAGGKYMALGMENGDVSIWNIQDNRTIAGPHHSAQVLEVEFSPDGQWVVSSGADSTARAIRLGFGSRQQYSITHGDWVEYASFSPDSSWFATASDDGFIRVIDTLTGQEKFRMAHDNFIRRVRVSPDGQWIVSASHDQTARVWDAFSGAQMIQIPIGGVVTAIAFNQDSTRLLAADRNGNVTVWDTSQLNARAAVVPFKDYLHEGQLTQDGKWLIANTDDKNVWKIPTAKMGQPDDGREILFSVKALSYSLDVSPDSKWVAALEYDGDIREYNREILMSVDGAKKFVLTHENFPALYDATFTSDSQRLITTDINGLTNLWDVQSGKLLGSLTAGGAANQIAVSPDGKYLAMGMDEGNHTLIFDLGSLTLVKDLPQLGSIYSVHFSPDGSLLATGSSEADVRLWSVNGGAFDLSGDSLPAARAVYAVQFDPSGKTLAIGDLSGYVYLWDVATRQEIARMKHVNKVTGLSYSADGEQLAVSSLKNVNIWNVNDIPQFRRDNLAAAACARLTENFSPSKWKLIFFDEEYRLICPNLPEGLN